MPMPALEDRARVTRARIAALIAKEPADWTKEDLIDARSFLRAGRWYVGQQRLADLLGLRGDDANRTVRRYESGDRSVPPPTATVLQYILQAVLDNDPNKLLPRHRDSLAPLFSPSTDD